MTAEAIEKMQFGADVSRLLDIVARALYSNKDVFLRELISNASDACDRLRYEAVSNAKLLPPGGAFKIRVAIDRKQRRLTVSDNGIGMTRQELAENLGTIAKSGTAALMEQVGKAGTEGERLSLIGQFGVGFYACFMAADSARVISRRAGEKDAWCWESDGRTGFSIRPARKDEIVELGMGNASGTAVILTLNAESSDYLIEDKVKQVITAYSDHIAFPIYLNGPEDEEKPVNSAAALWTRPKAEVTAEQYTEFYKHITHGFDEPLMTSHWRAEGKIEYTGLLFIPMLRPWDLYDPTRRHAVRLYVKRVFITDECEGLVYPWLRFLRGVIDSEDLPLNISREMLQHNPLLAKIRSGVGKKVLADLDKLSQDDPHAFAAFWGQFGPVLKEGLYDAAEHREALLKVVHFHTTHESAEPVTSLTGYKTRMKDGQNEIYYISGENLETLKNSPQLEGFRSRGLEVLLFTDTIDDFWLQSVPDFEGKKFKSVTKGDIDLAAFAGKDAPQKDNEKQPKADNSVTALATLMKDILRDEISDVRVSSRLTDSPVCLIAAQDGVDLRMERVLKIHQNYKPNSKRILEINPQHALILSLSKRAAANAADETLKDAAHLLMDQARIIQGEPVPDPAAFARRMAAFMGRGLG